MNKKRDKLDELMTLGEVFGTPSDMREQHLKKMVSKALDCRANVLLEEFDQRQKQHLLLAITNDLGIAD